MTSLVDGYWRDVACEGVAESSPHSVGKVILKPDRDRGAVLCLDGQQRCTANMLLLASIHQDAALRLLGQDGLPHKVCFSLSLSIPPMPLSQSLCLSLSVSPLLMAYISP